MASVATESIESTVLAALEVLYRQHLQPDQVQAADAYLRGFQVTPEAFSVAVALIDRFLLQAQQQPAQLQTTIPVLFFASQTLANKLRRQHALPQDAQWSFDAWCQKIIQWLAGMPAQMPKMVPTQLILALVACVPRIAPAQVAAASVQHVIANPAARRESSLGYLLNLLSAARVSSTMLAEVLLLVAEELSDVQERGVRERMQQELDNWAPVVLDQLLPQLMQDANVTTQQLVVQATRAWIRYARVSAAVVANNALMQSLVPFLRHEELFDVSVDLTVELVRCFTDLQRDMPFIQWVVPQVMQLKSDFTQAASEEDTEKCMGLCRIFTELGESYLEVLVGEQQVGQATIVDLLLDCMGYPESEIAEVTTSFWFSFLSKLERADSRRGLHPLTVRFQTQIMRLASICMHNLQFQEDFPKLPSDKKQDFKAFRQILGDILRDCCDALGVESILSHCVQGLQAIFQLPEDQRSWQAIEAHLYCIRSIGRNVDRADEQIISPSLQVIFQHLPHIATHPSIKYTASLIVSRYGLWLRDNSSFLASLVEFLHRCIAESSKDSLAADWQVASAAAMALRSLAIDCWSTLGTEILRFYLHVEKHEVMPVEDQVVILEGIGSGVVRSGDLSAVLSVLEQVVEPIVQHLSTVFAASASGQQVNSTIAMQELLRLICLYDYFQLDERRTEPTDKKPLLILTERVWAAFDQILVLFRSNDDLVERVCRCYKRMLRTCGSDFKPFLPSMVKNLLSFYQSEPKSSYLYAGSMVLKHFYRDHSPEMQSLLGKMIHDFVEATLPLFSTVETMGSHPDIVEEYFFLMERAVRSMPQLLVDPSVGEMLTPLLSCAVSALQISHNDANKGTLSFLEVAVERATQSGTPDIVGDRLHHIVCDGFVNGSGGREMINGLMRGIVMGSVPRYRVEDDYGSIAGVMVQLAKRNGPTLRQTMTEWFDQAQNARALPFLSPQDIFDFQDDLFSSADEREFRRVIRHFARTCSSRTEASLLGGAR